MDVPVSGCSLQRVKHSAFKVTEVTDTHTRTYTQSHIAGSWGSETLGIDCVIIVTTDIWCGTSFRLFLVCQIW